MPQDASGGENDSQVIQDHPDAAESILEGNSAMSVEMPVPDFAVPVGIGRSGTGTGTSDALAPDQVETLTD
jgi:hypothetical protein